LLALFWLAVSVEISQITVISGKVFEAFIFAPATFSRIAMTVRGLNARRGGLTADCSSVTILR